jgi:tRNA pseudouridine65 synthase
VIVVENRLVRGVLNTLSWLQGELQMDYVDSRAEAFTRAGAPREARNRPPGHGRLAEQHTASKARGARERRASLSESCDDARPERAMSSDDLQHNEHYQRATQSALTVLCESESAVVIAKPAWLLVHSSAWSGPRERTVMDLVREQLGEGLAPVHRLDRQTSGALVLARDGAAARAWQEALGREDSEKLYAALVRGCVKSAVTVDHALRDEDGVAKDARSRVEPVCTREGEARSSLVRVRIFTGRTHQVRRHCKHISHPVLGDSNYGKQPLNRWFRERFALERLALHALALTLVREDTGERLAVRCPVADDLAAVCERLYGSEWNSGL